MTNTPENRPDQIDRRLEALEAQIQEYREREQGNTQSILTLQSLSSELLDIARLHQQALRTAQLNAEADRAAIGELQAEVRGLQAESRRILDYLFGQRGNGEG